MTTPTFPVVSANFGKYTVNTMHGYLTSIDSTIIRDGLIPINEERKINLSRVGGASRFFEGKSTAENIC